MQLAEATVLINMKTLAIAAASKKEHGNTVRQLQVAFK